MFFFGWGGEEKGGGGERERRGGGGGCLYCGCLLIVFFFFFLFNRDLKPENLLLKSKDNDTDVRLADFGISRFFDEGFMKTTCGTPAYTAPGLFFFVLHFLFFYFMFLFLLFKLYPLLFDYRGSRVF